MLIVRLLGAARGKPRAAPFRTSADGIAHNTKASITTRAADAHGRCYGDGMAISTLDEYLETIPNANNRARMVDVLVWVGLTYPELELCIAWNQPIFTHHGTYIVGFSAASKHMAMAPRARDHDPLRASHARARHGLWNDVRPPTLEQALRLQTPRRVHSGPAHREAGHHVVLAPTVMKIQPRNDTQAPNNLYN